MKLCLSTCRKTACTAQGRPEPRSCGGPVCQARASRRAVWRVQTRIACEIGRGERNWIAADLATRGPRSSGGGRGCVHNAPSGASHHPPLKRGVEIVIVGRKCFVRLPPVAEQLHQHQEQVEEIE